MLLDTPAVQTGWKAVEFSLPDADQNMFSLSDCYSDRGFVIAFICNHCPYVKAIADRLAQDADTLMHEGINFVAINSNDAKAVPEDSPANMKKFARQHGFNFPYLIDEDQSVARAYDAVCTPDFFGFNATGSLFYRGRLDDAKMGDPAKRTPELVDAMRKIATSGRGPGMQHASMGCSIKWRKPAP